MRYVKKSVPFDVRFPNVICSIIYSVMPPGQYLDQEEIYGLVYQETPRHGERPPTRKELGHLIHLLVSLKFFATLAD